MKRTLGVIVAMLAVVVMLKAEDWSGVITSVEQDNLVMLVDGNRGACSGVVIRDNMTVLTAAHCTNPFGGLATIDSHHTITPLTTKAVDKKVDLALLTASNLSPKRPIVLADQRPTAGTPVMGLGFHGRTVPEFAIGHIFSFEGGLLWVDVPFKHGYSGGPLVNLLGQLVGIDVSIFIEPADSLESNVTVYGGAVPIDVVKKFLEKNK